MALERKYREELHANELVLLAYYIAAVNIEEVFRGRRGEDSGYEPFNGIVLTDTFNLNTRQQTLRFSLREWLPDNNERAERQQQLPIQVIVGNPPWSAGQRSASDDNPNVEYKELEDRDQRHLMLSVLRQIIKIVSTIPTRWRSAGQPIGSMTQGIIAFVTNGSWIDGNAESGVRACLAWKNSVQSTFCTCVGMQRTSRGTHRVAEGGKVFGSGSRTPVAV